jgi:hypothetical protein
MASGAVRTRRSALLAALVCALVASACGGGVFKPEYEYEEELYLSLDGSATLNIHASVASLVALRGVDLDPDPRARIDRRRVRALFEGAADEVALSLSRRDGRRFIHARIDVDDVRDLSRLAPFAWSAYRFDRQGDVYEFRQTVGAPPTRGRAASGGSQDFGWTGQELVAFRLHLPSEILFHNAPSGEIDRGNILVWEQPLSERLAGQPLDLQVDLETASILFTTLMLFGTTVAAVALTFALVVWLIARRGREGEMAGVR